VPQPASPDPDRLLPSWRPGATRDAVTAFLDASTSLAPAERLAVFDNDGTLWCERPLYPQLAFFIDQVAEAVGRTPELAQRPEYAALMRHDLAAVAELGIGRVVTAVLELFEGMSADEFAERSQRFLTGTMHPTLRVPYTKAVYQPMLELLAALRSRQFSVVIVSGGGTEFVRSISEQVYGIGTEAVIGTLVGYEYRVDDDGPTLVRTAAVHGDANEGAAKVVNIQQLVGRRPSLAAGNSAGDREMIDWTLAGPGPSLGLLVDHDDAEREMAYESVAGTFETSGSIVDIGRRSGWTVVSMRDDWARIWPD
jgi:phosphoserine phosphatase